MSSGQLPDFEAAGLQITASMHQQVARDLARDSYQSEVDKVQQRYDAEYLPFANEVWQAAIAKVLEPPVALTHDKSSPLTHDKSSHAVLEHWYVSYEDTEPVAFRLKLSGLNQPPKPPMRLLGSRVLAGYHARVAETAKFVSIDGYAIAPRQVHDYEYIRNKHGDFLTSGVGVFAYLERPAAKDGYAALHAKGAIAVQGQRLLQDVDFGATSGDERAIGLAEANRIVDRDIDNLATFNALLDVVRYALPEPVDYIAIEKPRSYKG